MNERPRATIRSRPEDFVVDELPAYDPSGSGDHLLLTFRKTGLDTPRAVQRIADGIGAREGSWAGMKDRHAITSQQASFAWPADRALPEPPPLEGIEVLSMQRHGNKLKAGHLRGNRFRITLRDLAATALPEIVTSLERIGREGVPNAFGVQRFGRDGDNAARALAWLRGETRPPRDKRQRRLLFSSLQSQWFNRLLERRVADGSWRLPLAGDLAQKHDTGGVFLVGDAELDDARARAQQGELAPTGPMFGAKMRWPSGVPGDLERAVLAEALDDPSLLDRHKSLGRGARRTLRLPVGELCHERLADGSLVVGFVLPKGGYATTVLSTVCVLVDATRRETDPVPAPDDFPTRGV